MRRFATSAFSPLEGSSRCPSLERVFLPLGAAAHLQGVGPKYGEEALIADGPAKVTRSGIVEPSPQRCPPLGNDRSQPRGQCVKGVLQGQFARPSALRSLGAPQSIRPARANLGVNLCDLKSVPSMNCPKRFGNLLHDRAP